MTNLDALNAWLDGQDLGPITELARTLAGEMDGDEWTAPVAKEYRETLEQIAGMLAEESDGEAAVISLLSQVGDQAG